MSQRYRIVRETPARSSDERIARYADTKRLLYNYQRAMARPKRPLYKDPRAFLILLLIVLFALFVSGEL